MVNHKTRMIVVSPTETPRSIPFRRALLGRASIKDIRVLRGSGCSGFMGLTKIVQILGLRWFRGLEGLGSGLP